MPAKIDITSQRFGSLTAVSEHGRDSHGHILWLCRCDCGGERIATTGKLRNGDATSCGCGIARASAASGTRSSDSGVVSSVTGRPYSSNTSGVRGVSFEKASSKWAAYITVRGKRRFLGRFADYDDAVFARKQAEAELVEELGD